MNQRIEIDGKEIAIKVIDDKDYISLTDMAKIRDIEPRFVIQSWLRNNNTLLFIQTWEIINNPSFNRSRMATFRLSAQENRNSITVKKLIEETGAIGMQSKAGRYGGTYAHSDIAFEFGSWLSPEFKMYLITEFQRLKSEESTRLKTEWNTSRYLSRINYSLQIESIKENIVPRLEKGSSNIAFATEADMLNHIVFGMTARQYKEANPDASGGLRDQATILELTILANLESMNAHFIRAGATEEARYRTLLEIAQKQIEVFSDKYLFIEE